MARKTILKKSEKAYKEFIELCEKNKWDINNIQVNAHLFDILFINNIVR